jgi:NADH-quinone oxidoreductase subunit J
VTFAAQLAGLPTDQAYAVLVVAFLVAIYVAYASSTVAGHAFGFILGVLSAALGAGAGYLATNDIPSGVGAGAVFMLLSSGLNAYRSARRYEDWAWGVLSLAALGLVLLASSIDVAAFLLFGAVILYSSFKVVSTRELVHATVWLAGALFGVAGLFLTLQEPFLAMIQVLVYVGAVITLFLFTVMLTIPRREDVTLEGIELPFGVTIEKIEDLDPETPRYGHGPMKSFRDTNPRKPVLPPATLEGVALEDNRWGTETTVRRKAQRAEGQKEE